MLYVNPVVHREYSSSLSRLQRSTSTTPRVRVPRRVARLVTRLVVDYFAFAARPGASARRAARRRLLRLHRASGCLGTSRDSLSTTSPPPRVQVPRRVARLVTRLVVPLVVNYSASRSLVIDYSVRRDFVLRPHWLYLSHAVGHDYLPCGNTGSTSSTPRAATTSSSSLIASTIHLD
jgi:hypothetical protein